MNKQEQDFISLLVIIFSFAYTFFYMLNGKGNSPLSFRYNQLFEWKSLKYHLLFATIFAILGFVRIDSLTLETYYFTPILFITSTLMCNSIIKAIYNRNILMEVPSRLGDTFSKNAKSLDKFFTFIIFLISLTVPIILKAPKFKEINNRHLTEIKNTAYNSHYNGFGHLV